MESVIQKKGKHRKWITCFTAGIFMMLFLFGCGKMQNQEADLDESQEAEETEQKLKIVVSNFPCYDFARAITGDRAEITMLIPPGSEVHSYEPTPQDMITIGNCDLFFYTGGESDEYIEEILDSFSDRSFHTIKIMDFVTLYEEETIEGMQVRGHSHDHGSNVPAYGEDEAENAPAYGGDEAENAHVYGEDGAENAHIHEQEEHHEEYDEHVWTSPQNAIQIIRGMEEMISLMDWENAQFYKENAEHYTKELAELDKRFEKLFEEHKEQALFVGDRFPFLYFAKEYGITYFAVFPSCNGESEPSAKTMAFFIEKAKEYKAKTIFYLELSNNQTARAAAEAAGAGIGEFHSCHNVTKEDFLNGVTYLELMERNYNSLREAF